MPLNINLYKNTAEPNRLDKTKFLTLVDSLNGEFREENSITSLSITIEYNKVPDFNYVYIPTFNRYYYVDDVISVRTNLWDIILSVDVLMSFKDAIKSCKGFVERNEDESNPQLIDKKRVIEQGYDVEVNEITNEVFVDYPDADADGAEELVGWDLFFVLNGYKIKSRHSLT